MAKSLINGALSGFKKVSKIEEKIHTPTKMTNARLDAFFGKRGLTDLLMYRRYGTIDKNDEVGVYEMQDGRRGFILQITPPPYLGSKTEAIFKNAIRNLAKEGHVLHIMTYASKNLDYELNRWREIHHGNARVDNPVVLKEWADMRVNTYRKWTTTSMMQNTDIRLRNFVTIISVLTPYGSSDDHIIDLYRMAKANFTKFAPICFAPDELMTMTNEIFKPNNPSWSAKYDPKTPLNQQMGFNTRINVLDEDRNKGMVTIDGTMKVKALTTVRMPKSIGMGMYQQLFFDIFGDEVQNPIPSSYLVSMVISAKDLEKEAQKAAKKAVSDQNMLRRMGIKDASKDPNFADRYYESVETVKAVRKDGQRLFKTMYEIFIFEEDENKLDRSCKSLIDRFKLSENEGWELETEIHPNVVLNMLLYSLPLTYLDYMRDKHLKYRFFSRWTSNNAATAPIVADSKGMGDFKNIYVGRTGQLIRVDFKAANNQNIIIIGPPGTGKSFLINDLLMSASSSGVLCRALDLGRSAKYVCKYQGGKHIEFSPENNICVNFFTNIVETEGEYWDSVNERMVKGIVIHPDEFFTIVPMIGLMCKQDLKSTAHEDSKDNAFRHELSTYIQQAVEMAHRSQKRGAGMKHVLDELKMRRDELRAEGLRTENIEILITGLHNYGNPNGTFYKYFNGPNTIDVSKYSMAVFEFEELRNMGDMLYIVQAGVMQRIASEFYMLPRELPKLIGLDEAKMLALNNSVMVGYLEDFALRMRKYNAIFYLATQASSHFYTTDPRAQSMYELASFKYILQRSEAEINMDVKSGAFDKDDIFPIKQMKSLKFNPPDFSEAYLLTPKGSVVIRIKVDPFSYWMYTTEASDFAKISNVMNHYQVDHMTAVFFLARLGFGDTREEALAYAKSRASQTIDTMQEESAA